MTLKNASRTKKAGRNVVAGYANRIILTILEFIRRTVFIRILGENLLGINGVFTNIIQIFSLAELGLNNVVSYSFYKPLAENDAQKISALICFYRRIYNVIALVVLGIGLCLFPFVPYIIRTDVQVPHVNLIYLVFLTDTVLSYLFVYKTSILNADQKGYIYSLYVIVANICRVSLQVAGLFIFKNIFVYLITNVIVNFGTNFLLSHRTDKEYPYMNSAREKKDGTELSKIEKQELAQTIKSGFIYKHSAILLNSTDNILVSVLVGTVWVGYLANYETIYVGLASFYTILFTSLTPSVGNLLEAESKSRCKQVFQLMSYISSWMAVVFSVCFFCLSQEFINLWLGARFVLDEATVFCKTCIIFLSCSMQPVFSFREAAGLYKKTKWMIFAAAVLNIFLSVIFGMLWQTSGIIGASVISMLVTYCWYEPKVLFKDYFDSSASTYFLRRAFDAMVFFILSFVFSYLSSLWKASNFLFWFLKAAAMFVFVNIACFLCYFHFPEFKISVERFKGGLKK